jgi:phasin family protein
MATVKAAAPKASFEFDTSKFGFDASKFGFDTSKFGDVAEHGKQNLEACVASMTAYQAGAEKITARAVAYSKAAAESQAEAAKSLMTSKSAQEFFEKQAAFTKTFFESYVAEMKAFQGLFAGVAQDVAKPISERAAVYQKMVPGIAA